MRKYKCPICKDASYINKPAVYSHMDRVHKDVIPEDMSAAEYYYQLTTGKTGHCVICKKPTKWNSTTNKYNRFCDNPKCKQKYREIFKKRMIKKYGKVSLTDDPEQQKKMLANRKISGKYIWSDKSKTFTYTGSYELDFLKYIDLVLGFKSDDVMAPSPHTFMYVYEEKEHFWIPDFFIPSLSLEIEIKASDNRHPKIVAVDNVKEALKDEVMKSQHDFNYIKIYDKKYKEFTQLIDTLRNQDDGADVIIICKAPYGTNIASKNLISTNESIIYTGDVLESNTALSAISVGSIRCYNDQDIMIINEAQRGGFIISNPKDDNRLNAFLRDNQRTNVIYDLKEVLNPNTKDPAVEDFFKEFPELKQHEKPIKLIIKYCNWVLERMEAYSKDNLHALERFWIKGNVLLSFYQVFAAQLEDKACVLVLDDGCFEYIKQRLTEHSSTSELALLDIIHMLIYYQYDATYDLNNVKNKQAGSITPFSKEDSEDNE